MGIKYISIKRVELITGIPILQLIDFSLDTDSINFYYLSSSGLLDVPLVTVKKLKQQLISGGTQPIKVHVFKKVTIDQLCMKDEDIRKCISYVGNQSDSENVIPDGHDCRPKGLLVAFDCWNHFYKNLSKDEGKLVSVKDREEWILKNYPETISESFRKEIAKVANPFPSGGKKKKN